MILPVTYNNFNRQNNQNIAFKGGGIKASGSLSYSLKSSVQDIIGAYKDIFSRLFSQSDDVVKEIQGKLSNIDISDISNGINILNAGENSNKIINISMPKKSLFNNDFLQFQLKDASTNEVQKTIFVADGGKVIKSSDSLSKEELNSENIERELENLINLTDFPLLKLRKAVSGLTPMRIEYPAQTTYIKINNNNIYSDTRPLISRSHHKINKPSQQVQKSAPAKNTKPQKTSEQSQVIKTGRPKINYEALAGRFDSSTSNLASSVVERLNQVKHVFAGYSEAKGLRIKNAYPDIQLKGSKNGGFTFKNLGKDSETITLHDVMNKKHGRLLRLIIENPKNGTEKYYLISDNRIVSNLNEKFPMNTPETLKYLPQETVASVQPIINKYFALYDEKLQDFHKFASEWMQVKKEPVVKNVKPKTVNKPIQVTAGHLSDNVSADLKAASELAEKSTDTLSKLSASVASKIKSQYKDVEVAHGLKMLIFNNLENQDIEKIGILNLQRKSGNLVKILVQKKDKEPEFYLLNDFSKIVSNYNHKTNQIPQVFKYADEKFINDSGINEYIKILKRKLEDYSGYINKAAKSREMFNPSVNKTDFVELINSLEFPKKRIYSEEYQTVMSECFENFSKVVDDIREKVKKFID